MIAQNSPPVALITGAAAGLGSGLARHFYDQGYQLFLVDRDSTALQQRLTELHQISNKNHGQQKVIGHCVDLISPYGDPIAELVAVYNDCQPKAVLNCASVSAKLTPLSWPTDTP